MKLEIVVPRWFTSLAAAGLVLAIVLAVFAPFAVYFGVLLAWYIALLALFARRSRPAVAQHIADARERGKPRPYVALKFAPWVETAARGWVIAFAVSTATTAMLLIVAVIELRLR